MTLKSLKIGPSKDNYYQSFLNKNACEKPVYILEWDKK
jgi:hypothetical protein